MPKTDTLSERTLWNRIRGSSRRCAGKRRSLNRRLEVLFPKKYGNEEFLLRKMLVYFGQMVEDGFEIPPNSIAGSLRDIHPEAFRFLSRHGEYHTPTPYPRPARGEPLRGKCYLNAQTVVMNTDLLRKKKPGTRHPPVEYVEGLAFGPLVRPMLHAWNRRGTSVLDSYTFDWTFYATSQWARYLGFPLTGDEYRRVSTIRRHRHFKHNNCWVSTQLFTRRNYGLRMRVNLLKVLAQRKRAGKKVPAKKTQPKTVPKKRAAR